MVGRLEPARGRWHYRLPDDVRFVALPTTSGLPGTSGPVGDGPLAADLRPVAPARRRGVAVRPASPRVRVRRAGSDGRPARRARRPPGPSALHGAPPSRPAGTARRGAGAGARLPRTRSRLPRRGRRPGGWRNYRRAGEVLEISVPLVRDRDVVPPSAAEARRYDGRLQVLSIGRLDREKNPLLLADVLADLRARDERWRLVVCGDGPLRDPLASRLTALGVAVHAELRGYVPLNAGLLALYRESHAVLHVSWTEGVPQILSGRSRAASPSWPPPSAASARPPATPLFSSRPATRRRPRMRCAAWPPIPSCGAGSPTPARRRCRSARSTPRRAAWRPSSQAQRSAAAAAERNTASRRSIWRERAWARAATRPAAP